MTEVNDLLNQENSSGIDESRKAVLKQLENAVYNGWYAFILEGPGGDSYEYGKQEQKIFSKLDNLNTPDIDRKIAEYKGMIKAFTENGMDEKAKEIQEELDELLDIQAR